METKYYLKFGQWGGPYNTVRVEGKLTDTTPINRSVSGYGGKIPTPHMVKWGNRWRRVYCAVYSNSGTCYINISGVDVIVDTDC